MIELFCKTTWTELQVTDTQALSYTVKKNKLMNKKFLIVSYCEHYQDRQVTKENGVEVTKHTLVDNPTFKKLFVIDIKSKDVSGFIKLFHDDFIKNTKACNYMSTMTWG